MGVILGRAAFVGFVCRSVLYVFHPVYRSAWAAEEDQLALWDTAVAELEAFKGVLPLPLGRLGRERVWVRDQRW